MLIREKNSFRPLHFTIDKEEKIFTASQWRSLRSGIYDTLTISPHRIKKWIGINPFLESMLRLLTAKKGLLPGARMMVCIQASA